MPEETRAFTLCRTFGWSEREYLDATYKFCDHSLAILTVQAETGGE